GHASWAAVDVEGPLMPGNSRPQGAIRKAKKAAPAGSGGRGRQALHGRGPTPRAEDRTGHPAARKAAAAARREQGRSRTRADAPELLVGRNPVVEALRAKVPATALFVALGVEADERLSEAVRLAGTRG